MSTPSPKHVLVSEHGSLFYEHRDGDDDEEQES